MADEGNPAVLADDDMLRGDSEIEGPGQAPVIDRERHREAVLAPILFDQLKIVVEACVDPYHFKIVAGSLGDMLEMRHLQAARDAPRRPEFEVDGFLSVEIAKAQLVPV